MKITNNKKIDVKRMLEIEKNKFCNNIDLEVEELEYLKLAIKMPLDEISELLNLYDNSSPKMDEVKFIVNLQNKYAEPRENVIKRIRQVRHITKYKEGLKEAKKLFELKNK